MLICLIFFAHTTYNALLSTATIQHLQGSSCIASPFSAGRLACPSTLARCSRMTPQATNTATNSSAAVVPLSKEAFFRIAGLTRASSFSFLARILPLIELLSSFLFLTPQCGSRFTLHFLHLSPLFAFLLPLRHRSPDFLSRRKISPKVSSTVLPSKP